MATNHGIAQLSSVDRQALDVYVNEFEQEWGSGSLSERTRRLPSDSSWRLPALAQMVKIDLERQWALGNKISLETYLQDYPELGKPSDVSADLIHAEYEVRNQFDSSTRIDEYARRFPAQFDEVRRLIASGLSSLSHGSKSSAGSEKSKTRRLERDDAEQELPERFGRYLVKRRLGAGAMGSVYLAEDTRLKRKVALKVANLGGSENSKIIERFYREAEAAAALDHPSLCKIYDVGEIDNVHYLAMEYIEGASLADFIASHKDRSPRQSVAIAGKLAVALQVAHANGIVHRDLKPANVMIRATGQKAPVIVDFGLALQLNANVPRKTTSGQVLGTLHYMPMEQLKGDLDAIGPPCDIYALGVIFYKLLTGVVPFRGQNLKELVGQILTTIPAPPSSFRPDISHELDAICQKAMAREIKDRYASMADFAAALSAYLGVPTTATTEKKPSPNSAATGEEAPPKQGSDPSKSRVQEQAPDPEPAGPDISKLRNKKRREAPDPAPEPKPTSKTKKPRSRRPMIALIAAAFVVLMLGGYFVITSRPRFETITNSIGMKLTLIPAGEFWMGSPDDDKSVPNHEKPRHKVVITKPFYIGVYEVTRGEIFEVLGQNPNGINSGSKDLPGEKITWSEASVFCRRLTELELNSGKLPAGWEYRLPTEAEWEYACRAGSKGRYSFGDDSSLLDSYAWCSVNSGKKTHRVGRKRPNAFGLYDMYGNVDEWCLDMFGKYPAETTYDPTGRETGPGRVRRGGNFRADASGLRSAERFVGSQDHRYIGQGFRVVRVSTETKQVGN